MAQIIFFKVVLRQVCRLESSKIKYDAILDLNNIGLENVACKYETQECIVQVQSQSVERTFFCEEAECAKILGTRGIGTRIYYLYNMLRRINYLTNHRAIFRKPAFLRGLTAL